MGPLVWSPQFGDDQAFVDGFQIGQHDIDVTGIAGAVGQQAQALDQQQGDQAIQAMHSDLLVGPVIRRLPSGVVRVLELAEHGLRAGLLVSGLNHLGGRPIEVRTYP